MELALFFWLAGVSEGLGMALIFSSMCIIMAFAVAFTIHAEEGKKLPKCYKSLIFIGPFLLLVGVITPSKDTLYTMAAAYGVQSAIENPNVQRMAGKSMKLLENKLDEYLKESNP